MFHLLIFIILCSKNCELIYYCGEECCLKNEDEHGEWCTDVQLYMITKSDYDDETSSMEIGMERKTSVNISNIIELK